MNFDAVMRDYGYSDARLLEQFHPDSPRLVCKVLAGGRTLLLRGLPDSLPEEQIDRNARVQEYLGNERGLAPALLPLPDGRAYYKKEGYWFSLLEYIPGQNLRETEEDEYALGQVLRRLHNHTDYPLPSGLNEDKSRFYGWFPQKSWKGEFDAVLDTLPDFRELDRCLIHSDIGPHNSLRTPDGRIFLIDLDDAGRGSRYLDLGWPFIMQFVDFNHSTGEMRYRFDLARAFLAGYYENNPLPKPEYDLIWQGAVWMHISYMKVYGPEAVDSLWKILQFGMAQKEKLWALYSSCKTVSS